MKKILLAPAAILLSVITFSLSYSQSAFTLPRAYDYLADQYGLDHAAVGDLKIRDQYYDEHNQVEHVYLVQTIHDHIVLGSSISLVLDKKGALSSVGHRLVNLNAITYNDDPVKVTAPEAIITVARNFGMTTRAVPTLSRTLENGILVYDKGDIAVQDIPTELAYVPVEKGKYVLAWKMQFLSRKNGTLYQSLINASTGMPIKNDVLTVNCSFTPGYLAAEPDCADHQNIELQAPMVNGAGGTYRALLPYIESPNFGTFELQSGLEDATASPFGWHDTNGVAGAEYTFTRGNNVHAFLDRNWDYQSDRNVDGGANLIFDFPYNPDAEPSANEDLAATNLFVRNNFMHDFTFRYGFNEESGNFQQTNYSGAGLGNDYVIALCQFGDNDPPACGTDTGAGECSNNASFATQDDGINGLMTMYTWYLDNTSRLLDVLQPLDLAGKITSGTAQFGPAVSTTAVTGEVVQMNDGTSDGTKGCFFPEGQDLTGKIALIDRGICDFSLKVYNAQEAGAIGAIICNFEDAILTMAPGDNAADVTIPSVIIGSIDCNRIRVAAGTGLVASLVAPIQTGPTEKDGSIDNSVISHEFGHGISTRLTGGPSNSTCLQTEEAGGMGEGWSDFFALATSVQTGDTGIKKRGIGTYVVKESAAGDGIRSYPYCTDMAVNPHTYTDVASNTEVHAVGEVWCTMLWDMYWAFVEAYGLDLDPVHGNGGNNIAIQLVMDGLKLQVCGPSFTDARDAILKADSLDNGGANQCLIWKVFARRGLGYDANAGDPNSAADGKAGFDLPVACLDDLRFTKTMTPEIKAGDNITVNLKVTNYKDFAQTNSIIEDQIPAGCSYVPGSSNLPPTVGNTLVFSLPAIQPDSSYTITYALSTLPQNHSIQLIYDDIENNPEDRWDIYSDAGNTSDLWFSQDAVVHSGINAWGVGDPAAESKQYLQNYDPYPVTGNLPVYRFYHYYDTEPGADGGFLEITTNNGQSWESLAPHIFRNGYPGKLQYGTFAIPNLYAFSGQSALNYKMIPVYIDLSDYKGENVKIRYRFGSNATNSKDGWYVDDVEIMDAVIYNAQACFMSDQSNALCAEAPERGTIVDSEVTVGTQDQQASFPFEVMPNPAGDLIQSIVTARRNEPAQVLIFDLTGHLVMHAAWNLSEGLNQKAFDITSFAPGMYVLQVKNGEGMVSKKFIKS